VVVAEREGMEQVPSPSLAAPKGGVERERLLSPWAILLFAGAMSALLVLLFPQESFRREVAKSDRMDAVSLAFARALVRAMPEQPGLRLALAQRYLAVGDTEAARQAIAPVLMSGVPMLIGEAKLLLFHVTERETYAWSEGSPARVEGLARLRGQLAELFAQSWDARQWAELGERAMTLGERQYAMTAYQRLAALPGEAAAAWAFKAAEVALGQGEHRLASRLYLEAGEKAITLEQRRAAFLFGLKALQSANLMQEALQAAEEHVGPLLEDEAALLYLVMLARAANRPALAERYVKALLRMAWLNGQAPRIVPAGFEPPTGPRFRVASRGGMSPKEAARAIHRPFDEQIFSLAYEVFLGNRNLRDAYLVSEEAVNQVPDSLVWRRRLAQVAEWRRRPEVALVQWLHTARRTQQKADYEQVLRLARGLYDYDNIILAIQGVAARGGQPAERQWMELVQAYEASGRADEAITYLESVTQSQPQKVVLEQLVRLYENVGRPAQSISTLERLESDFGPSLPWSMKRAALLSQEHRLRDAFVALQRAQPLAKDDDTEYWRTLGDLAWQLQQTEIAEGAYQVMYRTNRLPDELIERMIRVLSQRAPLEAAQLAQQAWRRSRQPSLFLSMLDLYGAQGAWDRVRQAFETLSKSDESLFAESDRYWVHRAQFLGRIDRAPQAMRAFQRAMALNPTSLDIRAAVLWHLIEQRQFETLREYTTRWAREAEAYSSLWGPFAAAYASLGEPHRAVTFYARQVSFHRTDYLWILNYADALEAAGLTDQSWRLRRYAWLGLRKQVAGAVAVPANNEVLVTYARLVLQQSPGDEGARAVRRARKPPLDQIGHELILAWALSTEREAGARAWLWTNYAKRLRTPAWIDLRLALEADDTDRLSALMATKEQELHPEDKVEVARRLGNLALAQEISHANLELHPASDLLHQSVSDVTIPTAQSAVVVAEHYERGVLASERVKAEATVRLSEHVQLSPAVTTFWQRSKDQSQFTGLPAVDRQAGATLGYTSSLGLTQVTAQHRDALGEVTALKLAHQQTTAKGTTVQVAVGRNQMADDTLGLQVGGVKDMVQANVTAIISPHDYASGQVALPWYYSQFREYMGTGVTFDAEVGHHFRLEYPDVTLRFSGSVHRYDEAKQFPDRLRRLVPGGVTPQMDVFVPPDFEQGALTLSLGDSQQERYSRGLRGFADLGFNYNSVLAWGQLIRGGLVGSVLGGDRLALFGSHSRGGFGRDATVNEFGARYQLLF
jgi:tetratricopeptide (TPR) repeat protein